MVPFTDKQNIGRNEQDRGKGKAIAVPRPSAPQPATAAVAPPSHQRPAAASVPADAVQKIAVAWEANSVLLEAAAGRLEAVLLGKKSCEGNEVQNLISALVRGIDYALSNDHVPTTVLCLPPVIKLVYPLRNDTSLQPVISLLMIETKNACMNGWFHGRDAAELLSMANEQCSNYCMEVRATPDAGGIISKIMPRFYPKMILNRVIVAFEAKRGYDIQMDCFHIGRNLVPQERIVLFVVQIDNLETSSCIISPLHVSLLVNGKGVDRRCNTSQDNGPQFPSDITKMVKFGTNIIQAAGYYNSNCLIAIAFIRNIASLDAAILKDYVQPSVSALASDSELIEGPSRITLNCPISFMRIKTPVKGHLCKHHQCFDYENFMEMNSRNPSWRCPCCNQPTCFVDLRIDRNMAKILGQAGDEIVDVVIFADGSWKLVAETDRSKDKLRGGTAAARQDSNTVCQFNRSSGTPIDPVDLTMEDVSGSITNECADRSDNVTYEAEDTKPFQGLEDPHMVSMVPNVVTTHNVTDVVSPARNREHMSSNDVTQPTFVFQHASQIRQPVENVQSQQTLFGSSINSAETGRPPIPRNVTRNPIAIQAFPAQTQAATLSQRTRAYMLNPANMISGGPSSSTYRAIHSDESNAVNCDMDMLEASRTSQITVKQNRDNQEQRQHRGPPVQQQIIGLPAVQQAQQQNFRMHQPTNILPKSSMQAQQASQTRSGLKRREQPLGVNSAPPDATRLRMAASNPSQRTPDGIRMSGSNSMQATARVEEQQNWRAEQQNCRAAVWRATRRMRGSLSVSAEQQNWRATRRMRGSLSGSAYESALNQYLVPSTQPPSTVTSALDPILQFVSRTEQEGFRPDVGGRQPGQ